MSLGVYLGVDQGEIANIKANNIQYPKPRQKAYQVLLAWRNMGSTSTTEQLSAALRHVGRQGLAEELEDQQVNRDHKTSTCTLDNKKNHQ